LSKLDETIKGLKFMPDGLIPAVIIDANDKTVLMVAYMNAASLADTVRTGKTHFWSRSRGKYWMKGEESGMTQDVKALYTDCDKDTLVIEVIQNGGAACHEGYRSCFFRQLTADGDWTVKGQRVFDPKQVYKK
jgi:phosphoribosyl-AMP cyclohydrolase